MTQSVTHGGRIDPRDIIDTDWRSFYTENRDTMFTVVCEDGDFEIEGRWMLVNTAIGMPRLERGLLLSYERHMTHNELYSPKVHARCSTRIRRSLIKHNNRDAVQYSILYSVQELHNLCYTHLGPFIRTMDIFALGQIILDPKFHDVFNISIEEEKKRSIDAAEEKIRACAKIAIDTLVAPENKWNVLYAPLKCGVLKTNQFHQVVMMIGSKTDTDDYIFPHMMECSYLSGMRNITDLAVESRSALKAAYYNDTMMPTTQYLARRIQIMGIDSHRLYKGDCGTDQTVPYVITEKHKNSYLGKYAKSESGLVCLDEDNIDQYVNKEVHLRATGPCRHDNGYCEVCGGTLTENFHPNMNVNMVADVKSVSDAAQMVLHTKHFAMASSAIYTIPPQLQSVFRVEDNSIIFRDVYHDRIKEMAIGFQPKDIARVEDIRLIKDSSSVSPEYFSDIKYLNLGHVEEDGTVSQVSTRVSMKGDEDKVYPYLSPETLRMIEEYPECIWRDSKLVWIKLKYFDPKLPFLKHVVINDSIKLFVSALQTFVMKDIGKYKSYPAAVHLLRDYLWSRDINTHITHIETMIKSFLITGSLDYSIGLIDHVDDVRFGTLSRLVPRRSIGGQLVFEREREYLESPATSILPKKSGQFDEFFGFTDICERDRFWPPGSVKVSFPNTSEKSHGESLSYPAELSS